MFRGVRQVLQKQVKSPEAPVEPELKLICSHEALLVTERRAQLLTILPTLAQLPPKEYQSFYLRLVQLYAEFVQELPETKNGYYPYAGGLLDHGLERAVRALALSRNYVTAKEGDTKEAIIKQAMLRYVIFTVALLYDVGRLATKMVIMICNAEGIALKRWNPYEGSMIGQGTHYKYVFETANWDYLCGMVAPILARQLMSKTTRTLHKEPLINASDGFSWMAQDKDMLELWFALFKSETSSFQLDSVLGIVNLANAQLIANYCGLEVPMENQAEPTAGFWDKYGTAITAFALETIKDRQKAGEKLLNSTSERDKKLTGSHELDKKLTSKEFLLREDLKQGDAKQSDLAGNLTGDLSGGVLATAAGLNAKRVVKVSANLAAGLTFMRWLIEAVKNKSLTTNNFNALLHRVREGVFLTKGVFEKFAASQSQYKDVNMIRKQFAELGVVLASSTHQTSFQYALDRPGMAEKLEGMLVSNPLVIFQSASMLPEVNKSLHLVGDPMKVFAASKFVLNAPPSTTQAVTAALTNPRASS